MAGAPVSSAAEVAALENVSNELVNTARAGETNELNGPAFVKMLRVLVALGFARMNAIRFQDEKAAEACRLFFKARQIAREAAEKVK